MQPIQVLFWDVGGVLLTDAWDHEEREKAYSKFALKKDECEARHKEAVTRFEEGKLSLDEYLQRVVFFREIFHDSKAYELAWPLPLGSEFDSDRYANCTRAAAAYQPRRADPSSGNSKALRQCGANHRGADCALRLLSHAARHALHALGLLGL